MNKWKTGSWTQNSVQPSQGTKIRPSQQRTATVNTAGYKCVDKGNYEIGDFQKIINIHSLNEALELILKEKIELKNNRKSQFNSNGGALVETTPFDRKALGSKLALATT